MFEEEVVVVFSRNEAIIALRNGYAEYWMYPEELGKPKLDDLKFQTYLSIDHYKAVLRTNGWIQEFNPETVSARIVKIYIDHLFVTDDTRRNIDLDMPTNSLDIPY